MSLELANRIAKATLYEGYLLYPYYPTSTKNRQRWTFGGVYPRSYVELFPGADSSEMQTECLLEGGRSTRLQIRIRFLHLISRTETGKTEEQPGFDRWEEACEREVTIPYVHLDSLLREPIDHPFSFPAMTREEGKFRRCQQPVFGNIELRAIHLRDRVFRIHVRIENTTEHACSDRDEALLHSLISTHTILHAVEGDFVSQIAPPEDYEVLASGCRNLGTWPVLVGNPGERSVILSSPIILYDYPEVAPESPGDLFDAAEIDEILTLRILTLTDEEKTRIRESDERGRALLDRTEKLTPDDLLRLHGRLRELKPATVRIGDTLVRAGDRVRIRPRACERNRADVFDIALAGMIARVESIEQTLEGETHLSVTLDEDPGRDLGLKGIPGHRFFFSPDELEAL